jgi:hypothetical protein
MGNDGLMSHVGALHPRADARVSRANGLTPFGETLTRSSDALTNLEEGRVGEDDS